MKLLQTTLLLFLHCLLFAQEGVILPISLNEAVELSQSENPAADIARKNYEISQLRFKAFQAGLKPTLSFDASVPGRFRGFSSLHLPDGREAFLQRSLLRYRGGLSLNQKLAATGGNFFISSNLERLDLSQPQAISYLASPISLGIQQTIFGFNPYKWTRQIESLRLEESKKRSVETLAEAAWQAAAYFLDVFEAQTKLETANLAKADAESLLLLANQQKEAGKIALDEYLQIQLLGIQSETDQVTFSLALQKANEKLQDFLGMATLVHFQPVAPNFLPEITINPKEAIAKAYESGSIESSLGRRLMEAKMQVAEAKAERNPQLQVIAQIGLAQTNPILENSYRNLQLQEFASVGISFPIMDWGLTQANLEMAHLKEKIESVEIQRERLAFERAVQLAASQINLLRNRAILTQESAQTARQVREISRNRYELGKITFTDLQLSFDQEKRALQDNLDALREFWLTFYLLRKLTLFDFETGKKLSDSISSQ